MGDWGEGSALRDWVYHAVFGVTDDVARLVCVGKLGDQRGLGLFWSDGSLGCILGDQRTEGNGYVGMLYVYVRTV